MIAYEFLIAAVMLIGLILYALLGGADFGGGIWDLLALGPRARAQREAIANAIAPVWEANHVWLILVIVLLFTAFPSAFAAIMTVLFIPMTLVLIGIVLRGSAFVFRKYGWQDDPTFRRWSTVFGISSFFTPFFLGTNLGALATGTVRLSNGAPLYGFLAGWTTPFALGCGLFAQALFAFLAAVYLTVDTRHHPELQSDFRLRALISGVALAPIAYSVFFLSYKDAPIIFEDMNSWWGPWLLLITSLSAIGALAALWWRRFTLARAFAILQVGLILLGWGLAQYPYLAVPDYTLGGAAGPQATLRLVVIGLAVGAILLFPSLGYLFYVFKGRGDPLRIGEESAS